MRATHRKAINCLRLKAHKKKNRKKKKREKKSLVEEFTAINLNLELFLYLEAASVDMEIVSQKNKN